MTTVRIPTQLRTLSGGASEVSVEGNTLAEVLEAVEQAHPGFRERLFDDTGKLRRFVNVFVADEDVRFLDGLDTKIADGQTVSIVPAVAGGADCPPQLRSTASADQPITRSWPRSWSSTTTPISDR